MKNLFNNKKFIIGMIHFPPLLWFEWYPWFGYILEKMKKDINALVDWGVDGIIIENNYDIPHTKYLEPQITLEMYKLALEARKLTNIPIGICCLRNDRKSAISIAKSAWLDFVRIPVFVDHIMTNYWYDIQENSKAIIDFKNQIGAENVKIICDIQVKHSDLLNKRPIWESAVEALNSWSNWLIITWKRTWDLPQISDLLQVREKIKDATIIVWSGATLENIPNILDIIDGVIVWTYFKTDNHESHNINLKSWEESINKDKVLKFTQSFKNYLNKAM